jgi:putative transposase
VRAVPECSGASGSIDRSLLAELNILDLPKDSARKNSRDMANTYTQIYIQVVFAVEARQYLIRREHKEELQKYMTGVITQRGQKLLAIHCMPDHTHVLMGLKPSIALSDVVRELKNSSCNFVNGKQWVLGRFGWQEGFGAFSYGQSQLPTIIRYIQNQEEHHSQTTFREEYVKFLKKYEIEHEERFIFQTV